jgi:hypothetical protein
MRMRLLAALAMTFTLALVGTAFGQANPTQDAYGGVLGEEVSGSGESGGSTVVTQSSDQGGSLPFTGLELGLVVLAGFGLVALGLAMRRTTRPPAA